MKKLSKTIFLYIIVSLVGCSPISTASPTLPPNIQPTTTPVFSGQIVSGNPAETLSPSPPLLESVTITPYIVPTAGLGINCPEILPDLPDDSRLFGKVILEAPFVDGKGYIGPNAEMDLAKGTLTYLPWPESLQLGAYRVSPDGMLLAYIKILYADDNRRSGMSLVVEDATGKILSEVSGKSDFLDTFYWLDNDRIVIGDYGIPYVLNPFTEEFITPDWYDQFPGDVVLVPQATWETNGIFDSRLERLFFLTGDGILLLWDLESKQILFQLETKNEITPIGRPKWAWDDSQIVLAYPPPNSDSGVELFGISRDGQITQLTELGKNYSKVSISMFSWSPDGRKIAFFFVDRSIKNNTKQLAVLDMDTLEVTNYCDLAGSIRLPYDPIWSPDSQMLLIGRVEADEETYSTVLLDLVNGYAATLAKNLVPSGWMVDPWFSFPPPPTP